jgi:hypothetical protein
MDALPVSHWSMHNICRIGPEHVHGLDLDQLHAVPTQIKLFAFRIFEQSLSHVANIKKSLPF